MDDVHVSGYYDYAPGYPWRHCYFSPSRISPYGVHVLSLPNSHLSHTSNLLQPLACHNHLSPQRPSKHHSQIHIMSPLHPKPTQNPAHLPPPMKQTHMSSNRHHRPGQSMRLS
ncbi:hypothetical protein P152DRAFT_192797 [Eremomyces bilateralis CBS 781.70]|uniref:Uncharacterized protein n=1 Tax=Eremomyces bilateralis CBS 781.70 TaxID=1392243 RepID=A0A6G1GCB9_9PEZI|nr:uncharacterized protein P152DRAFT_192797 [Eremomyces bilateralis CBS 781.70]KAF1815673.1 hypothetical protein P152DRAFT_192797 [Eremomyces bilateralis CBS 781.70]